ncbi:MAG: acetyl-CoA carboxylase biotin carboxyl carrier protein [Fimbriimonadaceae bacterium]
MAVDLNLVRHALTVARKAEFASLALEAPNLTFTAELGRTPRAAPQPAEGEPATEPKGDATVVRCPLVGYFAVAPTPVKLGDRVSAGDVIGIVSALGIPNEVLADLGGIVEQFFVADGDPVEYGQPLLKVTAE